jgi:carbon storage regulator
MLVLTRKPDQSIIIGSDIEITVLEVRGEQVRLGIRAPRSVAVHRKEVFEQINSESGAHTSHSDGAEVVHRGMDLLTSAPELVEK